MRIKTILNRVQKFKSFVYRAVRWVEGSSEPTIEAERRPRVNCPACGVRVERMPWATGKYQLTETYAWFLAGWTRRLSWSEVVVAFRTTWEHVFGQGSNRRVAFYMQRYVETVLASDCQKGEPCDSCFGSVPHRGAIE